MALGSIVRFTSDHYPMLRAWYAARGRIAPNRETLSDMGYVVDGRVIAFLYLTNSTLAMIEGIISDPNSVPSLRRASLQKAIGFLIDQATLLGYENIFAFSKHPSITSTISSLFKAKTDNNFTLLTLCTTETSES